MQLSIHRPKEALRHSVSLACQETTQNTDSFWTLMGIVCPLMNLERLDVTSDMNLNHRHAYLHHANLQTRKFNKPHRTLIHNNNGGQSEGCEQLCVYLHKKSNRKCSFTLLSCVNCKLISKSISKRGCMYFIVTFICGTLSCL